MTLTRAQGKLLDAVAAGDVLKVHRTLDGAKEYRLHPLDGAPFRPVSGDDVEALVAAGYIASNMKFPAATFVPTEKARCRPARRDYSNSFHNN